MTAMPPRRPKIIRAVRPDTYCRNPACGKRIGPGRHGRRRYCNKACKQAAWRNRRLVTSSNSKSNGITASM